MKTPKKVVSFRIDPKLAAQAQTYAVSHDLTVSETYELAVKRLVRESAEPVTKADLQAFAALLIDELPSKMPIPALPDPEPRRLTFAERISGRLSF